MLLSSDRIVNTSESCLHEKRDETEDKLQMFNSLNTRTKIVISKYRTDIRQMFKNIMMKN